MSINFSEVSTTYYPHFKSICLWIDVEGAEFEVIQGIRDIKSKILAIHVETAIEPQRIGQHTLNDLDLLLESLGFKRVGRNFKNAELWGDAVYFNRLLLGNMKYRYYYFLIKSYLSRKISNSLPQFIKKTKCFVMIKKIVHT